MPGKKMHTGLSICGGGILGIGPLTILKNLEKDLQDEFGDPNLQIQHFFDCYAGTSTGSIITALLVSGISAQKSFRIFKNNAKNIFTKYPWYKRVKPKCPTYDHSYLFRVLKAYLGNSKMNALPYPTFIPTTRMNGKKAVEKVWDDRDDELLRFAVATSTAAPTYFDVIEKDGQSYCDGGLWANDATMVLESGMKLRFPESKLRVLVLNTGMSVPSKAYGNMSLIGWAKYLIDDWVARTGNSNCFEAMANLGKENFMRISPTIEEPIELDKVERLAEVIEIWETHYTEVKTDLLAFVKNEANKESESV